MGFVRYKADILTKLGYTVVIIQPKKSLEWIQKGGLDKSDIGYILNLMHKYNWNYQE